MKLIVAHAKGNAIGHKDKLPWNCPADMKFFISKSKEHINLLMGRVTSSGIGTLKGRNIYTLGTGCDFVSVSEVIDFNVKNPLLICGGAAVYKSLLKYVDVIYVTELDIEVPNADTFFPSYKEEFVLSEIIEEGISNNIPYKISKFVRSKI